MDNPPIPSLVEMEHQVNELIVNLLTRTNLQDRLRWLDETGWMMPRDAIALGEMLDDKDETIEYLQVSLQSALSPQ